MLWHFLHKINKHSYNFTNDGREKEEKLELVQLSLPVKSVNQRF